MTDRRHLSAVPTAPRPKDLDATPDLLRALVDLAFLDWETGGPWRLNIGALAELHEHVADLLAGIPPAQLARARAEHEELFRD
jgi:hypothetical protein